MLITKIKACALCACYNDRSCNVDSNSTVTNFPQMCRSEELSSIKILCFEKNAFERYNTRTCMVAEYCTSK